MRTRALEAPGKVRSVTTYLVAALFASCWSSVAAVPADHGCPGVYASARVCGDPGTSEPLPAGLSPVVPAMPHVVPALPVPGGPRSRPTLPLHVAPATPRAPPLPRG